LQVIDLILDPQDRLWKDTIEYIMNTDDHLKSNYINIKFDEFLSFPAVIENDKIICFSGLHYNERRWGKNLARFSSRMWVHPDYRIKGISKFTGGPKFLNSTYCLPLQIQKAKEVGLDTVFISRESNLIGFSQYIDLIKINCNLEFEIKPNRYNVCGRTYDEQEGCVQYVAVHHLTDNGNETWVRNMTKHLIVNQTELKN
jgi:hypothetical protein